MQKRLGGLLLVGALALTACQESVSPPSQETQKPTFVKAPSGDAELTRKIEAINQKLRGSGIGVAIEAIEFFTIGNGRPSNRIHQQPFRWVPNDARRLANGDKITYLVDQSDGATASGLSSAQTEGAIDRAMATWQASKPFQKVDLVKRADTGADPDIFDSFFGFGGFGNPFLADITNAGWLPRAYFEAVGGPGGGDGILAFSVTFIFEDDNGTPGNTADDFPTDINGDNYLDTALNEVYYNDNFGSPVAPPRPNDPDGRASNPWGINIALPGIDVETVALHENGHSLELGHFGPPPAAVMNPVYAGILHAPMSTDLAGMFAVWGSWPNP